MSRFFPGSESSVPSPFLVALLLVFSGAAFAQQANHREGPRETMIAGDYFGAGGSLAPGTKVEGDAFVAGGEVVLRAPIGGDAVTAGGSVTIAEKVEGDLYATGGSVVIDAPVGHNARIAAGRVDVSRRGQIAGKATLAGGRVTFQGRVGKQLAVFGEHVVLDGEIGGDATVAARTLSVGPHARIVGRLTFRGPMPAQVDPAAVIGGGIGYLTFDFENETFQPLARVMAWAGAIAFTVGLFLIGVVGILLMPSVSGRVSEFARSRPFASLTLGFAMIVCVPAAAVLLALSIIGIPFAFVMLMLWPVMLIFGYLSGVMAISDGVAGQFSRNGSGRVLRIFLLALTMAGMLVFSMVPFAGWAAGILLMVGGVGAMTLNAFGAPIDPRVTRPEYRREPTFRL